MRYKCLLSYDGFDYNGYQRQNHDSNTIQGTIEDALLKLFDEKITIYASGRTDAKVHALGQVFHFDSNKKIPCNSIVYALNNLLPISISILKCEIVSEKFHSRYSVKKKVYQYKIAKDKQKNPFEGRYACYPTENIDIEKLKKHINLFVGVHDFRNFTVNKENEVESFVKTIYQIKVKEDKKYIYVTFTGKGFLRYMVRMMMGALLYVCSRDDSDDYISNLLDNKLDQKCSYKAPAEGLYLKKVVY